MGNSFSIVTDAFCDLPHDFFEKHQVTVMPSGYSVGETSYDGTPESSLPLKDLYAKLRQGAASKTVALAPDFIANTFRSLLEQGQDIIYLAFSSGLSSTYNSGRIAKEELEAEYPECNILIVDSLCASLGQGMLVDYAVKLRNQGKNAIDTAQELENKKRNLCHYFTVDDLHFLHRGGRVSKTTAILGSVLGIKPILHVNEEGKLISIGKVRGRKQSLENLVQKMEAKTQGCTNDIIFISHGDCEQDAQYVADLVKKKFGINSFLIDYVGPAIGSHAGPGTVALFFFGTDRAEKPM